MLGSVNTLWAIYPLSRLIFLAVIVSLPVPNSATAGDTTAINAYRRLLPHKVIYRDDVEHGKCGTGIFERWNPAIRAGSTCKKIPGDSGSDADWPGLIEAIRFSDAVSGTYVYALPTQLPPPGVDLAGAAGIHTAKFNTSDAGLMGAQFPLGRTGVVRYSAYYYIASGFDDTAWHIQMQWKGIWPAYGAQNPKIAWGFHLIGTDGNYVRQIQLTIRDAKPEVCELSYEIFTSADLGKPPLPLPSRIWVKVTVEVKFDPKTGYVKIWQGEGPSETLVVEALGVNTVNQLISESDYLSNVENTGNEKKCADRRGNTYYWSASSNLAWGVTNYLSTLSYLPVNRTDPSNLAHVLYVDDIEVARK